MTVDDICMLKLVHPGYRTNPDGQPASHLRPRPSDGWYFTGFEQLGLSDSVADRVMRYRGGGQHRFTVTLAGLKAFPVDPANLPNLERLIARKSPRSLLKGEVLTPARKAELAKLRPGLEVR